MNFKAFRLNLLLPNPAVRYGLCILLFPVAVLFVYVFSIVWRVSLGEQQYYGRSELIPISLTSRVFDEAPVPASNGSKTYRQEVAGRHIVVWRQKINGFQHMYGSALASYELGDQYSDILFRLNELAEFTCDFNGVEPSDLLDRKKDLLNNALGRKVGQSIKNQRLFGVAAEEQIALKCFEVAEDDPEFLPHYVDYRVVKVSENELGCGWLPQKNLFNWILGR